MRCGTNSAAALVAAHATSSSSAMAQERGLKRLTDDAAQDGFPSWSPDGRYVVFDRELGNSMQIVSASSGTPIGIVPESIPVSSGSQPQWSPDSTRISLKAGADLRVLDVATGRTQKILNEPGQLPIAACWSRDGQEIYAYLRDAEKPPGAAGLPTRGSPRWGLMLAKRVGETARVYPVRPIRRDVVDEIGGRSGSGAGQKAPDPLP